MHVRTGVTDFGGREMSRSGKDVEAVDEQPQAHAEPLSSPSAAYSRKKQLTLQSHPSLIAPILLHDEDESMFGDLDHSILTTDE